MSYYLKLKIIDEIIIKQNRIIIIIIITK